jgi:hypothetical protein
VTVEAVNADSLMAARIRKALRCEGVIKHEGVCANSFVALEVDAGADVVSRDNQVVNSCRVLPVSRQDRPTCKG